MDAWIADQVRNDNHVLRNDKLLFDETHFPATT